MRHRLLACLLATLALGTPARAQRVEHHIDSDRASSTVAITSAAAEPLAAVSIGYTRSRWRPEYAGQLDRMKGTNYGQLGTGWWPTLDTVAAIEVAGVRIEAGSYFLGVRMDQAGAVSLLLFDSRQAMRDALRPTTTALYTGEKKPVFAVPLATGRRAEKDLAERLVIEITADEANPRSGKLAMRWGILEASAAVAFHFAGATGEAEAKKE